MTSQEQNEKTPRGDPNGPPQGASTNGIKETLRGDMIRFPTRAECEQAADTIERSIGGGSDPACEHVAAWLRAHSKQS